MKYIFALSHIFIAYVNRPLVACSSCTLDYHNTASSTTTAGASSRAKTLLADFIVAPLDLLVTNKKVGLDVSTSDSSMVGVPDGTAETLGAPLVVVDMRLSVGAKLAKGAFDGANDMFDELLVEKSQ
jgi:hypothetical protein